MIVTIPPVTIISVGKIKDPHYSALVRLYSNRLKHTTKITVKEITDRNPETEGKQICALLGKMNGYSYALSEEGRICTSRAFASSLAKKIKPIVFIIGGPSGLSDPVKQKADELLSLSRLTFTHEMAQVLLFEQLYRACSILNHRAYHKE